MLSAQCPAVQQSSNPAIYNPHMSDLIRAAQEAREYAYAPYSRYKVGAAVRTSDGRIWTGCNVENVSYPLSVCAERNAVASMVRNGCTRIEEVAIVTKDGETPCGGCLQVLLEFCPDPSKTTIHVVGENGEEQTYSLAELLPFGFGASRVDRTER
ncbi:MAG: cytidine deaminase [Fimbriimonadales bacterium]